MARVGKSDWVQRAQSILSQQGHDALTIDNLCAHMSKTKGRFYHHFGDAEGLRTALLDKWEQQQTTLFIEAAEADPKNKAQVLDTMAANADWAIERAIRTWAVRDPDVQKRLEKVDKRRVSYLATLYPKADAKLARDLALIEYAALVGAQHLSFVGQGVRTRRIAGLLRKALEGIQ